MPVFKIHRILELGKTRLFLRMEVGVSGTKAVIDYIKAGLRTSTARLGSGSRAARGNRGGHALRGKPVGQKNQETKATERVARVDRELDERRTRQAENDPEDGPGIKPENIIWIFGSGRTGSTWLGGMMGGLRNHSLWNEPYVGEVFGSAYYLRSWDWQREREGYILSNRHKQLWLRSMRDLILDGAKVRYPEANGYLVIKEPHGSIAAPLLMEALPESRMVFLVRDPRDVLASRLDAHKQGSWTGKVMGKGDERFADIDPDAFVKSAARMYLQDMEKVRQAYDAFEGRKALVKYESLRSDTFEELKKMYSSLSIPVAEEQLQRVVERHSWENIPEDQKGAGKSRRKASPGSWREDLTPEQAALIEQITAPVLEEFYTK
jgi:Sulfotransferase domain